MADNNNYVSLLEQAVASGPNGNVGKGKGAFSKTGPEAGMQYRGVTVDGDKILNWEGEGDQPDAKPLGDIDSLVSSITKKNDKTKHEWGTPDEVAPIDILDDPNTLVESDDGDLDDELEKDDSIDDDELDVDAKLKESNIQLTKTETEVISRLIKEMTMLEDEMDVLEEQASTNESDNIDPEVDLDLEDI